MRRARGEGPFQRTTEWGKVRDSDAYLGNY
jgi:hypothetical protein